MSDDTTNRMTEFLKDHPRMMGALFTLILLLTQAGSAVAGESSSYVGP